MNMPALSTETTPTNSGVARLLAVTSRLTKILEQEFEYLETGRPREIKRFETEKLKLTGLYRREMAVLRTAAKTAPGQQSSDDISAVRAATEKLVLALGKHGQLLAAKREATEGVLQAIGKEVARRNKPVENYGKDGELRPAMPTYAATHPTTLSLDQRV